MYRTIPAATEPGELGLSPWRHGSSGPPLEGLGVEIPASSIKRISEIVSGEVVAALVKRFPEILAMSLPELTKQMPSMIASAMPELKKQAPGLISAVGPPLEKYIVTSLWPNTLRPIVMTEIEKVSSSAGQSAKRAGILAGGAVLAGVVTFLAIRKKRPKP